MNKSESIKEIAKALLELQGEIGKAVKDATNPFFNSNYATLEAVSDVAREPLKNNGLAVTQIVSQDDKGSLMETVLIHTSGEWISSAVPIIDKKGDMQGLGSAITYARRYGLAGILGIVQEDDDGNGTKPPVAKQKQPEQKPELNNGATILNKIATSTDPTKLEGAYKTIKSHETTYTKSGFEAITKAYNKKMADLLEAKQ